MESYVKILKIDNINTLVIKQEGEKRFFNTTSDSFIISINNLAYLLKYLLFTDNISPKLLEGILGEYYDFKG